MSRFGYLRTPLPSDPSAAAQADAHACPLDALGIRHAALDHILPVRPRRQGLLNDAVKVTRIQGAVILGMPAFVYRWYCRAHNLKYGGA
jgi:hypothetical protein